MRIRPVVTLISHSLFARRAFAQGESNGTYPTVFRADGFNSTENALDLGTTPVVPLGDIQANDPWSTPLVDGCPKLCTITGPDVRNWTHVHDQEELFRCEEPLLFTLNVKNNPDRFSAFSACALKAGKAEAKRRFIDSIAYKRQDNFTLKSNLSDIPAIRIAGDSCGAYKSLSKAVLSSGPTGILSAGSDAAAAADSLASYFENGAGCGTKIVFAKNGPAIVGVYSGPDLPSSSAAKQLRLNRDRLLGGTQLFQICNSESRDAATLGVIATDSPDTLGEVQEGLKVWAEGKCADAGASGKSEERIEWTILSADPETSTSDKRSFSNAFHQLSSRFSRSVEKRATCTAIQVNLDDGCASLAARCGIRGADFMKYNTKSDLCSTLVEKQYVCCSAGDLPDVKPKPQPDGTCATYTIARDDGCAAIEASFGLARGDLEKLNTKTWGWAGCSRIQPDQIICLSTGNPPMPAQLPDIACGPQKNGTQKPSGTYTGFDLAKLNQCPLKACCSGWGYCGTTVEFCTESKSDTGAPGSFKYGENGCISNCGMDIVNNKEAPASFAKLAYFQAYNGARDCLNMDVEEISESDDKVTHVHFAFAGLTSDFNVNIPENVRDQFEKFTTGDYKFKKIISFGGWAESTEPGTFQRYKDAVKGQHRQRFAENVVAFVKNNRLDGVDFDWEYPGAKDIPGVPDGGEVEAQDYLRFLTVVRGLLPKEKSLSIALPASFWYLKPFPVEKMAALLDYFVYMTYDLHGQWDYGNKWANPGCANGNCLRSHINSTETLNALSMITKAGVPAKKIFVGVSSYGRSFRMADKSCTGELCQFTGSFGASDAEPGQCTGTGGYISNAELDEIYDYAQAGVEGFSAKRWYDKKTDSDMMTYGTQGNGMTDWVAYMTDETKDRRANTYKGLNFGGITDWAIDLARWHEGKNGITNQTTWNAEPLDLACDSNSWPKTLKDLEENISKVPVHCRAMALLQVLSSGYSDAIKEYQTVKQDYDDKFGWYADWVKDAIDERLDEFMKPISGKGNKYIDCKWETSEVSGQGPCTEASFVVRDIANPGPRTVEYFLPIRDDSGFWKALEEETGIKKGWVQFRDHAITPVCRCPNKPPCPNLPQCQRNYFMRKNMPRRIQDTSKIDIDNPKAIIDEAIPNMAEIMSIALATYFETRMGMMDASGKDVVTALAMPLFMLEDASESIKNIKEIGEEAKEAHTRDLVMMILTIVFSVIPFAGQAAQALGGATRIAQAALIVGEAGNAALTIVEIVKDPLSAPFAILGMLIGAGGIRQVGPKKAFKNAADARRALDSNDGLKMFSDAFKAKDKSVQNIIKACVR